MPESRSELKKYIDELNASLPEQNREDYKSSTNIENLKAIIERLKASIAEQPEAVVKNDDGEDGAILDYDEDLDTIDDGFSDDNAVVDEANTPTSDENVSDDESVTEDQKDASRPNIGQDEKDVPMKMCRGNHSMYPDTKENFPTKYNGNYSRAYLISKRLITK